MFVLNLTYYLDATVTATNGVGNKAGATRTSFHGFSATETLLQYVNTPQVKYYEFGVLLHDSTPVMIGGALYTNLVNVMKATNIITGPEAGKTSFKCKPG